MPFNVSRYVWISIMLMIVVTFLFLLSSLGRSCHEKNEEMLLNQRVKHQSSDDAIWTLWALRNIPRHYGKFNHSKTHFKRHVW